MKILYRLGFYLGGFSIGLILLAFFIKGSGVELPSCDYLPNARLLKTIRNNGYALSPQAEKQLQELAVSYLKQKKQKESFQQANSPHLPQTNPFTPSP